MGKLWDFISGPASSLVDSVGGVIDNLHTSDDEKLKAKRELLALQQDFQRRLLDADVEWAKTQASVIREEAASKHWLAANWRPITMLVFVYIIAHNFVFAPLFSAPTLDIPTDMWELLKIGLGGYVFGRTGEKMMDRYADMKKPQ